jgi:hypothetical protein
VESVREADGLEAKRSSGEVQRGAGESPYLLILLQMAEGSFDLFGWTSQIGKEQFP